MYKHWYITRNKPSHYIIKRCSKFIRAVVDAFAYSRCFKASTFYRWFYYRNFNIWTLSFKFVLLTERRYVPLLVNPKTTIWYSQSIHPYVNQDHTCVRQSSVYLASFLTTYIKKLALYVNKFHSCSYSSVYHKQVKVKCKIIITNHNNNSNNINNISLAIKKHINTSIHIDSIFPGLNCSR